MGVPSLKAKAARNYRKARHERVRCEHCTYFVPDFEVKSCGMEDRTVRIEGRCKLIGLAHSRKYRVLPHFVCDDFVWRS